ncbi:CRAL/TRIO domain-containing protein [Agrocybe pediades]|nr:CRAL/TRIO domain-containing protein [Agrocybe pediades]
MDTRSRLQTNRDALLEQYHSNLEDIYTLQDTLIRDILPSVTDELALTPEVQEWAKEWLSDTSSMFRLARRNKFTRSFSLEAIQKTLLWRIENLWPLEPPSPIPNLHCLPSDIRDPFGRPILVLEVTPVDQPVDSQKRAIIRAFEQLRLHLRSLYDSSEDDARPPLQYVVLLDLAQLSLQSINIDLFTWSIREVIPRYSGMIAAVFMLNYSWTHSGLWSVFKRLLPETALSRVFFPSNKELVEYFSPAALPQDYGGNLPSLALLEDPVRPLPPPVRETPDSSPIEPAENSATATLNPPSSSISWLSPTSLLNPFFGYPVVPASRRGPPSFQHGRRRKRDLLRTLMTLFWMRWRKHITLGLLLTFVLVALRLTLRKSNVHLFRSRFIPHWLLSNRRPIITTQ